MIELIDTKKWVTSDGEQFDAQCFNEALDHEVMYIMESLWAIHGTYNTLAHVRELIRQLKKLEESFQ